MNLRMRVLTFTALGLVAMFVFPLRADEPAKGNRTQQASPAPDEALRRLKEGNARFVADMPNMAEPASKKRIQLSGGQRPIAVVLTCADSRVAPEIVFDKGLGMLFVQADRKAENSAARWAGRVRSAVAKRREAGAVRATGLLPSRSGDSRRQFSFEGPRWTFRDSV